MNNQGEVTTQWADGTYSFRLSVRGILELEEKCDAAFAEIFNRIVGSRWKALDIIETIRIGLIGGGTSAAKAMDLVDRYWQPLSDNVPIARAILAGAMFGFAVAPVGEEKAAPESPDALTPPPLPQTPPASGSSRMSLKEFHSGNFPF